MSAPNPPPHPILIVEDDPDDVALLERAFERARFVNPLMVVTDGDAAVAYLSGQGEYSDRNRYPFPELVLLDLKLPRRSGHEVLEWIRRDRGISSLPVVVLTASRENADLTRAYELGANSYLVKPATFQQLREMVEALDVYWMVLNVRPDSAAPGGKGEDDG